MSNVLLEGEGPLAHGEDGWRKFLSRFARLGKLRENPNENQGSLVARNFPLDESVLENRAESYRGLRCAAVHRGLGAWKVFHERYLRKEVFLTSDDDGPPHLLDPEDPEELPQTFRWIDSDSPYLMTDPGVVLVRVEELKFLADLLGEDVDQLRAQIDSIVSSGKSRIPRDEQALNGLFELWHRELDQRPVFAAFWEDVKDLFGAAPATDPEGWADSLRDRLGLAHLDPVSRSRETLDVLVFRYPVKDLPRIRGTGGRNRPLMVPTVLDGKFSDAFCPSPRHTATGHVVHLNPEAGRLRREVLHPRFAFRVSHLWRLGALSRGVEWSSLPEKRALHLLSVRDETGRDDYAAGTDWDLFQ